MRVVLVANRKGGVGKTSLVRSVAAVCAEEGIKTLVVDGDPQGNLSEVDFGLGDGCDEGRGLSMALQYAAPLEAVAAHGVDVVAGGRQLQGVIGAAAQMGEEMALTQNLAGSLGELYEREGYDLVLIDSAPGESVLMDTWMSVARWLVVPLGSDSASFAGLDRMGRRYAAARRAGAGIELLGAVLMQVDPRATARNASTLEDLRVTLGDAAAPFETMIRRAEAPAVDARNHGLGATEVAAEAGRRKWQRIASLRRTTKGEESARDWWSTSNAEGLAQDYRALTREILTRISQKEA